MFVASCLGGVTVRTGGEGLCRGGGGGARPDAPDGLDLVAEVEQGGAVEHHLRHAGRGRRGRGGSRRRGKEAPSDGNTSIRSLRRSSQAPRGRDSGCSTVVRERMEVTRT